jgi:ADP-heptose:LPS heptosyltransferase
MAEPRLSRLQPGDYERVVVFFANALGDQILALPTLRALSALFDGRFTLLTIEGPLDLTFGDVARARTVKIDISYEGDFDVAAAADAAGPADLVICPQTWHSRCISALLDRLAPSCSVGLNRRFDVALPLDRAVHQVDQMFAACRVFGETRPPEAFAAPFGLPDESVAFAEGVRHALGGKRLLVVHTETKPYKRWPAEHWNRTLGAFLHAFPDFEVIAVARHAHSLDALIPRVHKLSGLPLASAAALFAAADVFLGVDSYPLHVADLWQVPAAGMFGPSNLREFGFRFTPNARHIDGGGTMDSIDPDRVFGELTELAVSSSPYPRAYSLASFSAPVVTLRYR